MKTLFTLLVATFLTFSSLSGQVSFGEPQKINEGWKFQKGDIKEASAPGFDDSRWRTVDLPHDWSAEGPYSPTLASATGYLPGGIAWYRKKLEIPEEKKGEKVFVYFEGIYRNGEFFVNGTSLGMRPNGYMPVLHDVTAYVKPGETNTLAVRVDHSESADSRWYTGSGIYRDVWLVYAHPIHIAPWGVYATSRSLSDKQSALTVKSTLTNSTGIARTVTILQEVTGKDQTVISRHSSKITLPAQGSESLTQELKINRPHLWSLDDPYLYTLKTTVMDGTVLLDQSATRVGLRTFTFDANKGFALNGQNLKVKGVCLHHDAGCLGSAVPREVWAHRLKTLKSLGCNAIRTSHNPQAPSSMTCATKWAFWSSTKPSTNGSFPRKNGWKAGMWEPPDSRGLPPFSSNGGKRTCAT